MWFSLAVKSFLEYIDKVSEKSYKALILLLTGLFLITSVVTINKVDKVAEKVDSITWNINSRDLAIEKRIDDKMNNMFSDGAEIFQRYTLSNAEDLKTIIDKSSISADNSYLLKKIIDKSNQEIMSEVKKIQFQIKYLQKDSLKIRVEKVYSNQNPVPLYVASKRP